MMHLTLVAMAVAFTVNRDPGGNAIVWQTAPVTMSIQEDGSDDIDDGSDLLAIREALTRWSDPCSSFSYTEGPLTSSRAFDPGDGVNIITFLEEDWPGFASGAIGFAPEAIDTSSVPHRRVGVDVILKGLDITWATDGDPGYPDVGGVVTHELGHALGLWHSSDPTTTMYFGSKRGGTHARRLAPDDVRGLCFLYPATVFSCTTDADCPLYYGNGGRGVCGDSGVCEDGAAGLGLDCGEANHCVSGECVAVRYTPGANPGFCTQSCDVLAQDCPLGLCSDVSGEPLCYLHRESCVLEDEECGGEPWACVWDLDLVQRCLRSCAGDEECDGVPGAVCHGSYCRARGSLGAGEPCNNSGECVSLRCGGSGPVCQGPALHDGGPNDGGGSDGGDPMGPDGGDASGGVGDGSRADDGDFSTHVTSLGCGCRGSGSGGEMVVLLLLLRRRWW